MSGENTFLQRLRENNVGGEQSARANTDQILKSIQANLRWILNSREGFALAQPDYGAPAPNEITFGFPEAIIRMQRLIKASLENYEPRLTDIQVFHVENPDDRLQLLFHVRARLSSKVGSPMGVSFVTSMEGSGRISVRR